MREIDKLDFEVWYKANVSSAKARRIASFHFRYDAEEFIENQHSSIRSNYYLKVVGESQFYPNEIF